MGTAGRPRVPEQLRSARRAARPGHWLPCPRSSCVPEFFADTPVINGMAYPQLTLPAGVHRFRMLNGTQSRMWNLQLYKEDRQHRATPNVGQGTRLHPDRHRGRLPARAGGRAVGQPVRPRQVPRARHGRLQPGARRARSAPTCSSTSVSVPARASSCTTTRRRRSRRATEARLLHRATRRAGQHARTQHPHADAHHDHERRRRLRRHGRRPAGRSSTTELAQNQLGLLVGDEPSGRCSRRQRLHRVGPGRSTRAWTSTGGCIQILGTGTRRAARAERSTGCTTRTAPGRERRQRPTEVWDIYNTTGDIHPIHFHLVNVQILGRAPFAQDADGNPVALHASGAFVAARRQRARLQGDGADEPGRGHAGHHEVRPAARPVVNVLGKNRRIQVPKSPRTGGYEYVWHCHILEHEEHDMMRPLVVF